MWESELERLRKLQAERLREARKSRGFRSALAAAKRFGWPSTYGAHENGTRGIGRMYREYAKKFRVNPAWLLGHSDERDSIVRGISVVADAAIGTWHEAPAPREPKKGSRSIVIPTHRDNADESDRFAVRMADASMNKLLAQGAYGVLVHADNGTDFKVGDVIYVERMRDSMTELSLRRVAGISPNGLRLTTYSVDPRFKQELFYPSKNEAEKIRVIGKLVGKYEDYSPA